MEANATLQGQHKSRHLRTAAGGQIGARRPTSRQNSRNLALGGKDLIIRMLAEVFQVNQTDSGQVKWQQVSSSLVPVSLYSRTTSSWLNYLLAAPTANAATSSSGMSPDSRDFLLLLLQQFHHQQQQQQQQQQTSNKALAQQSFLEHQNQVVFQVVAHDYLDGQCKKILNVKLVQPGTRLGQASDYFVYWKEQPSAYNHLQTSLSFNSNNSLSRLQNSHLYNEQQAPPQTNQFVATCCGQSFITQTPLPMTEPQTWGLNFASINDAKLFCDICSLNLVDLDFNSEYLKQLTLSLTSQNRNNLAVCQNLFPQAICGQPNEQKLIVDFLNYKQRQHNHSSIQASNNLKFVQQQNPCQLSNSTMKKQLSQTKCPSCKHLLQLNDRQGRYKTDGLMAGPSNYNHQCSIRTGQSGRDQNTGRQLSTGVLAQVRSRSSTRQLGAPLDETAHSSLKRARSFSTPATPEHNQDSCLHQQSGTDCEGHLHKQKQQDESHHPRCLSYIRQQKLRAEDSMQLKKKPSEADRPRKPARGVLRDSNVPNMPNQRFASVMTSSNHQGSVESSQVLHSKRVPKPRYMGRQSSQDPSTNKHKLEQAVRQDLKSNNEAQLRSKLPTDPSHGQPSFQTDQLDSVRFSQSKSAQRRYTGVDSTEMSHFDSLSHHSASLARAQYANSKNMKEFLSLDAGGVPPAPGQIANMNQKFEEQMKAQNYRRQNKVFKQSVEQIKPSDMTDENDQAVGYREQESINAKQISTDSEHLKDIVQSIEGPNGVDLDATRHASTTTDDLPLDPLTKRRMYKLTSEEVISEKTEPKSLLMTRWELGQQNEQHYPGERDKDRQTRAISLGPELDDEFRGRDKRSDTGRRRSLERSMCVDLDPASTVSSAFRKTYCLSPLEQSASPMAAGGVNSFENSPSFYGGQPVSQLIRVHQEPLVDTETPEDIPDKHTRFAGTPKRARTRSSSSYRPSVKNPRQQKNNSTQSTFIDDGPSPFHSTNYKKFREEPIRFEPSTRMMSFKSAPDVTYYGENPRESNNSDYRHTMNDNVEFDEQSHLKLAASNIASHSSYAVPLCSKVRSSQYGREFHSCPSSLRRVKRDPHHHCHGQQQLPEALMSVDDCIRQPCSTRVAQNDCSYCVCGRRSANADLPAQCAIYDEANFATARNKSFSKQQRRQRRCQHQYNHHHHHTTPVCMNNVSREQAPNRGLECCLTDRADCMHASAPYRTCSSLQSCRSPLRYGLYESDCDEDPGDEEMAQASAVERPCQELTTCHTDLPSTCCAAKSSHSHNEKLARSASSFYFRPLDASTIIPLKPVNGYDQTMSRSSLKSRQRARSQPPREPPETVADTFHLNKSMETVQKLIKEVQNELNALKRCPLESFYSRAPSGATKSQLNYNQLIRSGDAICHTASRNASAQVESKLQPYVLFDWRLIAERGLRCYGHFHQPQEESKTVAACEISFLIKMSNEEANPSASQTNIDRLPRNVGSSATRGASQFKNVGAIRKAGFLSVKKWILKRRQSIELARKQGWKRYWVCLRGTALLFYSVVDKKDIDADNEQTYTTNLLTWIQANCMNQPNLLANILKEFSEHNDNEGTTDGGALTAGQLAQCYIEKEPRHLIMIEGAIAQPIPEHPKRDFVFCLSTTFGDAYLFQSSCQLESENWILSIHNACAASIARDLTRDEAIKLFETKIRHLELEAEKKLFLRQRLESRLTLMSSLNHASSITNQPLHSRHELDNLKMDDQSNKKVTMRALLCRLNQQLLALDTHIERVHCEIYQLRCYLTSCGNQSLFYQNSIALSRTRSGHPISPSLLSLDLPHPRSLLQHVSKPTKLLLIKMGVFTVSSFHAFVHARQGGVEATMQKSYPGPIASTELRPRSQSISEAISTDKTVQNVELENDTEKLLDMANLRIVPIRLSKRLFEQTCRAKSNVINNSSGTLVLAPDSDSSSYSVCDKGDFVLIALKLHTSSNSLTIIKQVLKIMDPDVESFDVLNYYLRLNLISEAKPTSEDGNSNVSNSDGIRKSSTQYEVKRGETLNDWSNYESLELVEKILFRAELTRSRLDEDSAPFGISIGAQLFLNNSESFLNVYCSYIEWGSVADKSGLRDDDELLMINGVPVMDLDLMFIECIIQDESKIRLVVRSCRSECPPNTIPLDRVTWSSPDGGPDGDDKGLGHGKYRSSSSYQLEANAHSSSQIISDEYISSLVCPPPPRKSDAFLRTDCTLLRQKSDLSAEAGSKLPPKKEDSTEKSSGQTTMILTGLNSAEPTSKIKSISQTNLVELEVPIRSNKEMNQNDQADEILPTSESLEKTEQLNQRLGINSVEYLLDLESQSAITCQSFQKSNEIGDSYKKSGLNSVERLRKSILELFETEYAYIKHLETISEHYMSPLEEVSYLGIPNLKQLDKMIKDLLAFQRDFFRKLTSEASDVADNTGDRQLVLDEFEQLNGIIQKLDSYRELEDFEDILNAIAKTFVGESENFKIYAAYCAAYSSLQRILHPKNLHAASIQSTFGNPLDTFLPSSSSQSVASNQALSNTQQHREFLKPFSASFMPKTNNAGMNELSSQLKQITQFLSHLDSSSSSASLSLPKSSSGSEQTLSGSTNRSKFFKQSAQANQAQNKSVHQQNFESYLIKPIQRIVKYPILLKSIAGSAQLTTVDEPHQELIEATKHMESITGHVNDAQRIHDEYGFTFEQIERQYFTEGQKYEQISKINHPPNILLPHKPQINLSIEELLYFGPVEWLNINEYTSKLKKGANLTQVLFVFNSCVVFICKESIVRTVKGIKLPMSSTCHNLNSNNSSGIDTGSGVIPKASQKSNMDFNEVIRYQSVIPVSEVQVRSVPVSSQGTTVRSSRLSADSGSYQWELFRCSSVNSNSNLLTKSNKKNTTGKVYLLANQSNDARNAFLRKIRFIIRESVRNMSVPLARSPSSKSLTPKKLSSPTSSGGTNTNNSSCSHSTSLSPVRNIGDSTKGIQGGVNCDYAGGQVIHNRRQVRRYVVVGSRKLERARAVHRYESLLI